MLVPVPPLAPKESGAEYGAAHHGSQLRDFQSRGRDFFSGGLSRVRGILARPRFPAFVQGRKRRRKAAGRFTGDCWKIRSGVTNPPRRSRISGRFGQWGVLARQGLNLLNRPRGFAHVF